VIVAGQLMLPEDNQRVRIAKGWLVVEQGKISAIHEGICPLPADFGSPETVIAPGFVDIHVHLPQYRVIGTDGETLLDWLKHTVFPVESRWQDPVHALREAEQAIYQLMSCGTTSFASFLTSHAESAWAVMEFCEQREICAVLGQVLQDRNSPPGLQRETQELLNDTEKMLRRFPPSNIVEAAITPRFAPTCSETLLRSCGELAKDSGALVQTHLAETQQECRWVEELFGKDYVSVYEQTGLLTNRSLLAHGVWLTADQLATLAHKQSTIVHCPTSNAFLTSGVMDWRHHEQAGVALGLATDIAGGFNRSMVREAQAMLLTARQRGNFAIDAERCWWQITTGNAQALGKPGIGKIAVGGRADLALIEPNLPWIEAPRPLTQLLYGWDDRWLIKTFVNGKVTYDADSARKAKP
jgi:guanine deaminase